MIITVFGNSVDKNDSLLVDILPKLKSTFPNYTFNHADPTENLKIPSERWWIMDLVQGIDKIEVFDSLDNFVQVKSLTVHDYDVYMDLKLREKLGELPKIKIIAVPIFYNESKTIEELKDIL